MSTDARKRNELFDKAVEDITGRRDSNSIHVLWTRSVIQSVVDEIVEDLLDDAAHDAYSQGQEDGYGNGYNDGWDQGREDLEKDD